MNWKIALCLIVIGILLAATGYLGYTTATSDKRIKSQENIISALMHPRTTTTITHDSIVYKQVVKYQPVPYKVEVIDSIPYPVKGTISWYDSTYRHDGIRFHWKSKVLGIIDTISFSDFVFPKDIITVTTHVDTCIVKSPEYFPKNHIGFDINLSANDFKRMPNFDGILWWSIRDKVRLNGGVEYNAYHNEVYGKVGIGIFLK